MNDREVLAAMMMHAMLASPELLQIMTSPELVGDTAPERCARAACRYADALLAELRKP